MHEILINGTNKLGQDFASFIDKLPNMHGVVLDEKTFDHYVTNELFVHFDYILDAVGNPETLSILRQLKREDAMLIQKDTLMAFRPILNEKKLHMMHIELLLNHIQDGIIFINIDSNIQMMNKAAKEMIGWKDDPIGTHILDVIPNSKLPEVLHRQEIELHKKLTLQNNREIITTRMPLRNSSNQLVGAFAIFKDAKQLKEIAEENTDLKEIKSMLEAIIYSSDEAISVVDENGIGLMINPAYTKITGLTEKDVIGQPATVDISEGESVHMKVLQTRRPIRGAKLFVGPNKKEVVVNVAPIIVQGKLKGSVAVIHDMSVIHELTNELNRVKQIIRSLEATYTFEDIIGTSQEMKLSIEQAKIAANTHATVLLRGESGTGKELFAHAIHNASNRRHRKFIRVNCAAIAESVLESELFGYEDGAFTGAKRGGKKGLFEEANYGTIFLDEIGDLSLHMQAKILRVLQEKEITKVGGTTSIPLDIRIITATNVNLEKAITNKKFREDLYYRLNRLPIFIPPLRDRIDDMHQLVHYMIEKVNQQYGRNVQSISAVAMKKLKQYSWPGNVRELENVISRAIIFMDISEEEILYTHLPMLEFETDKQQTQFQVEDHLSLQTATEQFEREYIYNVYKNNDFHKTNTAKQLNISVRNLYYKLEKYGID
ncbi:sigma-54-dependent Fis family transcriptional regulator [Pseudogracilibacillus sp. ICA-222130]|uniref:sigma-54 interaction domain-containing protein n=1 Tax=Pseudogracilibacillus sp. ICA-222130 TaxID=3134655 RepID=UPI0030BAD257